jgi:hypothetical protein
VNQALVAVAPTTWRMACIPTKANPVAVLKLEERR